jgi:hypothetical protein
MAEHRVERRLAAILAADVAGYSHLMGLDEEGTLARLKAHRRDLMSRAWVEATSPYVHAADRLRFIEGLGLGGLDGHAASTGLDAFGPHRT